MFIIFSLCRARGLFRLWHPLQPRKQENSGLRADGGVHWGCIPSREHNLWTQRADKRVATTTERGGAVPIEYGAGIAIQVYFYLSYGKVLSIGRTLFAPIFSSS